MCNLLNLVIYCFVTTIENNNPVFRHMDWYFKSHPPLIRSSIQLIDEIARLSCNLVFNMWSIYMFVRPTFSKILSLVRYVSGHSGSANICRCAVRKHIGASGGSSLHLERCMAPLLDPQTFLSPLQCDNSTLI
jgi:hypothetical protein